MADPLDAWVKREQARQVAAGRSALLDDPDGLRLLAALLQQAKRETALERPHNDERAVPGTHHAGNAPTATEGSRDGR